MSRSSKYNSKKKPQKEDLCAKIGMIYVYAYVSYCWLCFWYKKQAKLEENKELGSIGQPRLGSKNPSSSFLSKRNFFFIKS